MDSCPRGISKSANQARPSARGHAKRCPVCGQRFGHFLRFGLNRRRNARCPGCGSLERHRFLWLYLEGDKDEVKIRANSDAAIVSGLIALLTRVYSGCSAQQILDTDPYFIREIGLTEHLSPTRANGLHAMLQAIRAHANQLASS